jgi:translation initiation factor IF-2
MPSVQVGAKVWIVWGMAFPQQEPTICGVYVSQGHARKAADELMIKNPGWVYRVEGHRIASAP